MAKKWIPDDFPNHTTAQSVPYLSLLLYRIQCANHSINMFDILCWLHRSASFRHCTLNMLQENEALEFDNSLNSFIQSIYSDSILSEPIFIQLVPTS